jgi:hypothetical protein
MARVRKSKSQGAKKSQVEIPERHSLKGHSLKGQILKEERPKGQKSLKCA